jgi:hypothetical protein
MKELKPLETLFFGFITRRNKLVKTPVPLFRADAGFQ